MTKSLNQSYIKGLLLVGANVFAAAGIALILRAGIGVGPYDAFNKSLSELLHITVGKMIIINNLLFFLGQVIILGRRLNQLQWLQIPVTFLFGILIDIFYYYIFVEQPSTYLGSWMMLGVGTFILTFHIGVIVNIALIHTPVEGFCKAMSLRWNVPFTGVRWGLDGLFFLGTVTFMLSGAENHIREGTLFILLVFSLLLGYLMKWQSRFARYIVS